MKSLRLVKGRLRVGAAEHRRVTQIRIVACAAVKRVEEVPDISYTVAAQNLSVLRALPLAAGAAGVAALLANRVFSGVRGLYPLGPYTTN